MAVLVISWLLVLVAGAAAPWTWALPAAAAAVVLYRALGRDGRR